MAKQNQKSIFDEFEATSVKVAKKITEEEDDSISSGRSEFHQLKDGTTKIRILPKRVGEPTFMISVTSRWGSQESDQKGKDESRYRVPDGHIHGGLSVDPFEAYINFCAEKLADGDGEDKKKLAKISGSSFSGGLQPVTSWIFYGSVVKDGKITNIEKFEIRKTVRDELNKEMYTEDEGEPIEVDPFTHARTGLPVMITKAVDKRGTNYSVKVAKNPLPLTESDLQRFKNMTPLSKLPQLNYTIENFETALECIRYADEKHEINLFEDEEFQQIIAGLKEELESGGVAEQNDDLPFKDDDEDEKPVKKSAKAVKAKKKEEEKEDDEESEEEATEEAEENSDDDKFSSMSRADLIKYKAKNEYDVKIFKSDSDDDIRNKLREYESENGEENTEDEPEEEVEEKPVKKTAPVKEKGKTLTIDDIKKRLSSKK